MRHLQPCLYHLRVPYRYSHPVRLTTTAELPGRGPERGRWDRTVRRRLASRGAVATSAALLAIAPAAHFSCDPPQAASTMEHGVVGGSDSVSVPQAASGPGAWNSSSCACGGASASGVAHQRGAVATPGLLRHRSQLAGMQPFNNSRHLSLPIEIPVVTPVCRHARVWRLGFGATHVLPPSERVLRSATVPSGERARAVQLT